MKRLLIVGGGAAGFFAANTLASATKELEIVILEKTSKVLSKVKISGGGRCNVTNNCFEVPRLVKHYPRGEKQLFKPFKTFQPENTIEWFKKRGVKLKTEGDNRMFPVTDSSQTIIDCFTEVLKRPNVRLETGIDVVQFEKKENSWKLSTKDGRSFNGDFVLLAAGSAPSVWNNIKNLDLKIEAPVPSLFTFKIKDERLKDLMGISFQDAAVKVVSEKLEERGPLLITHWGLSGPAVLKLSAWGAGVLKERNYQFEVLVNFLPQFTFDQCREYLLDWKLQNSKKKLINANPIDAPARFWERLLSVIPVDENRVCGELSKKEFNKILTEINQGCYAVSGKSTFKDEFVTAGGIALSEINLETMASKKHKNLYFAGETINVDGITGGFNFQAAWTTSWLASQSILNELNNKQ